MAVKTRKRSQQVWQPYWLPYLISTFLFNLAGKVVTWLQISIGFLLSSNNEVLQTRNNGVTSTRLYILAKSPNGHF